MTARRWRRTNKPPTGTEAAVPRDVLLFARGGGLVTGPSRQRLLAMLDATVDTVFQRLAQRQNVSGL